MSRNIIMFPGQGSQVQGMGANLFKEFPETIEIADKVLGYDVVDVCLNNHNNLLNQTNYTQPALFLVNHLYHKKYVKSNAANPAYFLGHSLGEFNALHAAGAFSFETGLQIVKKRGELMFSINNSSMAAVIGADYHEVEDILKNNFPDIDIANINTPTQIVISGLTESLDKAANFFEDEGLAYIPLKVSGAFHSRYMSVVKNDLEQFIETMQINECSVPVISNYTALPYPADKKGIVANMSNQLNSPVKWLQSIEYVLSEGEFDFVELGPGEVLSNVIKKIKITI